MDHLADQLDTVGAPGRAGTTRAVPARGRPARTGEPGAGGRGRGVAAAHGEVPPRPAGRRGAARRGVPPPLRSHGAGGRSARQALPAFRPPGRRSRCRNVGTTSQVRCSPQRWTGRCARARRWRRSSPTSRTRSAGASGRRTPSGRVSPSPRPRRARSRRPRACWGSTATSRVLADAELCLANCPFDRLAAEHTELVCGMNRELVEGVLEGTGAPGLRARLAPHVGLCCVRVSA